jgi:RHS repeat-associated protein
MAKLNPFRFSTKYQDDETDLLYYGYRYEKDGRWLSRDPVEEKGGLSLYAFVNNAPVALIDALGRVARGGCMQMNCLNPCQKFRQMQEAGDRYVDAGGIVCCGGVKFVCMWAADDEKNQRAKQILKKCIGAHERMHLPRTSCPDCECGVTPVKPRDMGDLCQEELTDHIATKACYQAALSECGDDKDCIDKINAQITAEDVKISYYRNQCNARRK